MLPLNRTIFINNHHRAFEGISHHGPKVVADAHAINLPGMIGRSTKISRGYDGE